MKDKISRRNFLGKTAKVVAGITVIGLARKALAERLNIICNYSLPMTYIKANHVNGATEEYDIGKDSLFVGGMVDPPAIDFYFQTNMSPPHDKLSTNARGPNSMSEFYARIEGRGISGSVNANLEFSIFDDGQGNFDWKNFRVELYNENDISNLANKIAEYDAYDLVSGAVSMPTLSVHNGLSYQLKIIPSNMADIKRDSPSDKKVNLEDLVSMFIKRKEGLICTPENIWCEYHDINRSGSVDPNDVSYLGSEWLWDGSDPNTW